MIYFMHVNTGSVDTQENWETEGSVHWDQMVEVKPEGNFNPETFSSCESDKYTWIEV